MPRRPAPLPDPPPEDLRADNDRDDERAPDFLPDFLPDFELDFDFLEREVRVAEPDAFVAFADFEDFDDRGLVVVATGSSSVCPRSVRRGHRSALCEPTFLHSTETTLATHASSTCVPCRSICKPVTLTTGQRFPASSIGRRLQDGHYVVWATATTMTHCSSWWRGTHGQDRQMAARGSENAHRCSRLPGRHVKVPPDVVRSARVRTAGGLPLRFLSFEPRSRPPASAWQPPRRDSGRWNQSPARPGTRRSPGGRWAPARRFRPWRRLPWRPR